MGNPVLPLTFYQRDAETVARELIGKVLVRRLDSEQFRARIVETEAYVGAHDLACHAARALNLTRAQNGLPLTTPELHVVDTRGHRPTILSSPRIGVDYAGARKHKPLRFFDADSKAVSGKRLQR